MTGMKVLWLLFLLLTCFGNPALGWNSADAYAFRKAETWVLGTSKRRADNERRGRTFLHT